MTRRFRRTRNFDVSVDMKNPDFIAPPRDFQRNWLVNRAVNELVADLEALDLLAKRFVPGSDRTPLSDRSQAELEDSEIMEDWQRPLMKEMAAIAGEARGDVLEVGFGRGFSASILQELGIRSHTIIECNDSIVERFQDWRKLYPDRELRLVHGLWQETMDDLGLFDAVFFHTYPLSEEEAAEQFSSSTFAEHFFEAAAIHLRSGGVFTYLTNEIDSLSRAHQRALLQHFGEISIRVHEPLRLPRDVKDAWWADSMVVVRAVKQDGRAS